MQGTVAVLELWSAAIEWQAGAAGAQAGTDVDRREQEARRGQRKTEFVINGQGAM